MSPAWEGAEPPGVDSSQRRMVWNGRGGGSSRYPVAVIDYDPVPAFIGRLTMTVQNQLERWVNADVGIYEYEFAGRRRVIIEGEAELVDRLCDGLAERFREVIS